MPTHQEKTNSPELDKQAVVEQVLLKNTELVSERYKPVDSGSSWVSGWAAKAIASLAMLPAAAGGMFFNPSTARAENVAAREDAVTNFAEKSFDAVMGEIKKAHADGKRVTEIADYEAKWNNVIAALQVSDNTAIAKMDGLRARIIREGASNADIPARVVDVALSTTGVVADTLSNEIAKNKIEAKRLQREIKELDDLLKSGASSHLSPKFIESVRQQKADLEAQSKQLNQAKLDQSTDIMEKRRAGLSADALKFLGKVIVDVKDADGDYQRMLVPAAAMAGFGIGADDPLMMAAPEKDPKVRVYAPRNFDRLAGRVLALAGDKGAFDEAATELQTVGSDYARRDVLLDLFVLARQGEAPESVIKMSREWIFGKEAQRMPYQPWALRSAGEMNDDAMMYDASGKPVRDAAVDATKVENGDLVVVVKGGKQEQPAIPGLPKGIKAGSLEELRSFAPQLLNTVMPYPFAKSQQEQEFIAKNILFLAKQDPAAALPAAAQWFALKNPSEGLGGGMMRLSTADLNVIEALSICAQQTDGGTGAPAFEVLKRAAATNPDLFFNAVLLTGSRVPNDHPLRDAGKEMVQALRAHSTDSTSWIRSVVERKAPLLCPEAVMESDARTIEAIRNSGHRAAMVSMIVLNSGKGFTEDFKKIVGSRFGVEDDRALAMIGLAYAKDHGSIDSLLKVANDRAADEALRSLAMEAALFIDQKDFVPDSIQNKAEGEYPFAPLGAFNFVTSHDPVTGNKLDPEKVLERVRTFGKQSPFEESIAVRYNQWLTQEAKGRLEMGGGELQNVSQEDKIRMFAALRGATFAGANGALANRAEQSDEFRSQALIPMVRYLEEAKEFKKPMNIFLGWGMMDVLGHARTPEAGAILADIAKSPEKYAKLDLPGFFGIIINGMAEEMTKSVAISNLGGTARLTDAKDPAMETLHWVARKETDMFAREAALGSLQTLAVRYEQALKRTPEGEARNELLAARKMNAEQVLGHMAYHGAGRESAGQMRLRALLGEFTHAKIADQFGATKELLLLADKAGQDAAALFAAPAAEGEMPRELRPNIVRSVMHALKANGRTVEDIKKLDLPEEVKGRVVNLYDYVINQKYWINSDAGKQYTGKNREVAVVDVGYALPVNEVAPGLGEKLIYPKNLINWTELSYSQDIHPTAVSQTIHKLAPDAMIRTYNVAANLDEERFRTALTQDAMMRGLEDLTELEIQGVANVDMVNYSIGYMNLILREPTLRTELVDQLGAYMELLSAMGVKHSVAAGNSHGQNPLMARFRELGELNALPLRFDKDGHPSKPDGVFFAGAYDGYAGNWLSEFTSKQNGQAAKPIELFSYPGVHELLPWVEGPAGWENVPINGTSFATPNQTSLFARAAEAVHAAGLEQLTPTEWQDVLRHSVKQLADRDAYEGGLVIHEGTFWVQLQKVIDAKKAAPEAAPAQPEATPTTQPDGTQPPAK